MPDIDVRFGKSFERDARRAVAELAGQVLGDGGIEPDALIFFCSHKFDLPVLGKAIKKTFGCPAVGCTTAGEILHGVGYLDDSIICAAIASDKLSMKPLLLPDLRAFAAGDNFRELEALEALDPQRNFVLFLIDGLSRLEERVIARIGRFLNGTPLVGGSAGDGSEYRHTWVYHEGAFHENAAVLALFETTLPFMALHLQHFDPTDCEKMVVTDADLEARRVMEINGLPAAAEYARIIGVDIGDLTEKTFASHPPMLRIGGDYYVRAIQKANRDGSLTFYCAIDIGLVLTIGKHSVSLLDHMGARFREAEKIIPHPSLLIACSGRLRRVELQQHCEADRVRSAIAEYPFFGFTAYGEQFSNLHITHALTALILGGGAP